MRIDNLDLKEAHRSKKSWEPNEGRDEPQGVGGTYELAEAMGSAVKDAARRSSEDEEEEEEEQVLREEMGWGTLLSPYLLPRLWSSGPLGFRSGPSLRAEVR